MFGTGSGSGCDIETTRSMANEIRRYNHITFCGRDDEPLQKSGSRQADTRAQLLVQTTINGVRTCSFYSITEHDVSKPVK